MGSRGRSIRLRIYFLVAIPLITMLGLFAYVAYSSVTNFVNLDRAPSLIRSTSVPMANFMSLLQAERRAGVVYASKPSQANLAAYNSAIATTERGVPTLEAALSSPATKAAANAQETAAIGKFLGTVNGMTGLRDSVRQPGAMTPLQVLASYTPIIDGTLTVFQAEDGSLTNATASTQGIGLIATVTAREDMDIQDAVLAGALASGTLTPQSRVAFVEASGREQDDETLFKSTLNGTELDAFNSVFNKLAPQRVQNERLQVRQAIEGGLPLAALERSGLNARKWQQMTSVVANANFQGGLATASTDIAADQQIANNARNTVWLTGALGAAGLILTLIVTIFLGRSINRRLTRLRRSALMLAREHLPSVVMRLRRGESVDVAAEAPPLRMGSDEIGQVGLAFDAVRQTAIASAVEEARLRQGVNDVFRNLARRNQSLLQRQLTVLDGMERRATDADSLDDLFKLDHLTTRMRRHAEGLIILSGAPPGRGWSSPVKLVDVMRGAVAEVEDYARVAVSTQSRAALGGAAVTDVIHLLAELIENATTLSPPYTRVQVSGEMVANGFAIEIEDRGLGMTPARLAELNERLANPPDVNPANTEQLGLFVVAQLARRHGIQVTLRPSPYGGTTAVVLIPRRLVVEPGPAALTSGSAGSAREGVPTFTPTGRTAAMTPAMGTAAMGTAAMGTAATSTAAMSAAATGNGNRFEGFQGNGASGENGTSETNGTAESPPDLDKIPIGKSFGSGIRITGGYRQTASTARPVPPRPVPPRTIVPPPPAPARAVPVVPASPAPAVQSSVVIPPVPDPAGVSQAAVSQAGAGAGPSAAPAAPATGTGADRLRRGGRHGTDEVPVVTGVPVSPAKAPPFDVFTPLSRAGAGPLGEAGTPGTPGDGTPGDGTPGDGTTAGPDAASDPYQDSDPYQGSDPYGAALGNAEGGNAAHGNNDSGADAYGDAGDDAGPDATHAGLPRRVRQASLAPQLRSSPAAPGASTGVPQATAATLSDMRSTLSAMQRGWTQARMESAKQDTEGNGDES